MTIDFRYDLSLKYRSIVDQRGFDRFVSTVAECGWVAL